MKDKLYLVGLSFVGFGAGFSIASKYLLIGGFLVGIGLALIIVSYERS